MTMAVKSKTEFALPLETYTRYCEAAVMFSFPPKLSTFIDFPSSPKLLWYCCYRQFVCTVCELPLDLPACCAETCIACDFSLCLPYQGRVDVTWKLQHQQLLQHRMSYSWLWKHTALPFCEMNTSPLQRWANKNRFMTETEFCICKSDCSLCEPPVILN